MSHQVETMAYTGEVPWHGLGFNVEKAPDVVTMLKLAKLDWTVERRPLFMADGVEVDAAALVRSSDNSVLDVVGPQYTPVQNREAFEFFCEFVNAGQATMETAGSLRRGQYVWGLAKLGESFTLKGGDKVNGYLLVGCPHQQGKSLLFKTTSVRVVCNNTLAASLRDGRTEYRRAHRSVFDAARNDARDALNIAREQFAEFGQAAQTLHRKRMTRQNAIDVLQPIFAPKFDKTDGAMALDTLTPRMTELMDCLTKAPGAEADTAWGILNAATYYIDHVACRDQDRRMQQAWFGKGASQKEQVLELLMAA